MRKFSRTLSFALEPICSRSRGFFKSWTILADEHEPAVDLLSRFSEGLNHAHRVLPSIEPRNLRHQWTICRNSIVAQEFTYLPVRHFPILRGKRIDRRGNELLIDLKILA